MKLKFHLPEDYKGFITGKSQVMISKGGSFYLSFELCNALDVKRGDEVQLAQNEENPKEWYFVTCCGGFRLNGSENKKGLSFTCKKLNNVITKSIGLLTSKSYTLMVSKTFLMIGDNKCYAIITSSARQ